MNYNIDFDLAGIMFLCVFYLFLKFQYARKDRTSQIFTRMTSLALVTGILEILGSIIASNAAVLPSFLVYIVKPLYYVSIVSCVVLFSIYVRYLIWPEEKWHLYDRIQNVSCFIYVVICISNPATHWLNYVNEAGEYTHGIIHPIVVWFPICLEAGALGRIIYHRDRLSVRQKKSLISFVVISIVGTMMQHLVLPNVYLAFFSIMLGMVFLLFAVEAPNYIQLMQLTEELQRSKAELQEAKEKRDESSRVLHELMKTANWRIDIGENGEVTSAEWGPEFRRMVGAQDKDMPDHLIWGELLHPEDKEVAMDAFMQGMQGGSSYNIVYRLKDRTGEYRYYRGTGEASFNEQGKLATYQGVIQDVHDQEMARILANEKLKAMEELEKSQKALEKALEDAKQANKAKSQFLSNMSHDIRTPMNAVIGFTDLALEGEKTPQQMRFYLEKIKASGNHLLLLINDILDMSKIESGKLSIENNPMDLKAVVKNLSEILRSQAVVKGQKLTVDMERINDSYVLCDQLRLSQIIMNCVGNSIKFTPEGGNISIHVEQQPGKGANEGRFLFVMSDNGIGMSEDFVKRVFEPFERDRSSKVGSIQGSGLGMSIVKSLVELMKGVIRVESKEGQGTTFYVSIPMTILEQENTAEGEETQNVATKEEMLEYIKGKHALLVDDNMINRMIALEVLEKFELVADEAVNGQEAVDMVTKAPAGTYDLILMDIQMPVMNGYEATDLIRDNANEQIANIPIIAMTADAFEEDKQKCKRHKMNGHIAKPFNWDDAVREMYLAMK